MLSLFKTYNLHIALGSEVNHINAIFLYKYYTPVVNIPTIVVAITYFKYFYLKKVVKHHKQYYKLANIY